MSTEMSLDEAITYLRPIAESATVGHYAEALGLVLAAAGVTQSEPEYEYTWAGTDDEGDDWIMDDWFATVGGAEQYANSLLGGWVRTDNGRLARRVKAGAAEPAPNQEGQP